MKTVISKVVDGGYGYAASVKKGQYLKITDLEGKQIVDFIAFVNGDYKKYVSVAHMRSMFDTYDIKEGDNFYDQYHKVVATLVEDTYGTHDMSFPACNSYMYDLENIKDHRSCRSNFAEVLASYGIEEWMLPDPFNFFQNSPNMKLLPNKSKAGDYVLLKFEVDALIAVSACPYDLNGVNGGKSTPIQLDICEEE